MKNNRGNNHFAVKIALVEQSLSHIDRRFDKIDSEFKNIYSELKNTRSEFRQEFKEIRKDIYNLNSKIDTTIWKIVGLLVAFQTLALGIFSAAQYFLKTTV